MRKKLAGVQKSFPKVEGFNKMSLGERKKRVVERNRGEADRCAGVLDERGDIHRVSREPGRGERGKEGRAPSGRSTELTSFFLYLFAHHAHTTLVDDRATIPSPSSVRQAARGGDSEGSSSLRDQQELSMRGEWCVG